VVLGDERRTAAFLVCPEAIRDLVELDETCELRDKSHAGAGWEVQILEAGEILVSPRCETEREARYVAEAARKDSLRAGSTAVESDGG